MNVLYGSTKGVTARGDQLWRQDSAGVPGRAERGDRFGGHPGGGDVTQHLVVSIAVRLRAWLAGADFCGSTVLEQQVHGFGLEGM